MSKTGVVGGTATGATIGCGWTIAPRGPGRGAPVVRLAVRPPPARTLRGGPNRVRGAVSPRLANWEIVRLVRLLEVERLRATVARARLIRLVRVLRLRDRLPPPLRTIRERP